jgi:hypothetical protein
MRHEKRARRLLERAREGERSHALVRDLDGLAAEVREAGPARLVAEAVYTVLADSPELFVRSFEALFDDLASADDEVRASAAITFSWLAENPPTEVGARVPALIDLLRSDDDLVRGSAARSLRHLAARRPGSVATATNALLASLDDENPWIRGEACFALGHVGAEGAAEAIKDRQLDPSLYVCKAASWSVSQVEEGWAEPPTTGWELADLVGYDERALDQLVRQLWSEFGYETELTRQSRRDRFDVVARDGAESALIRVERYDPYHHAGSITLSTVQRTAGFLAFEEYDRVVVVTNSHFTSEATTWGARTETLELVDGGQLCDLLSGEEVPRPESAREAAGATVARAADRVGNAGSGTGSAVDR